MSIGSSATLFLSVFFLALIDSLIGTNIQGPYFIDFTYVMNISLRTSTSTSTTVKYTLEAYSERLEQVAYQLSENNSMKFHNLRIFVANRPHMLALCALRKVHLALHFIGSLEFGLERNCLFIVMFRSIKVMLAHNEGKLRHAGGESHTNRLTGGPDPEHVEITGRIQNTKNGERRHYHSTTKKGLKTVWSVMSHLHRANRNLKSEASRQDVRILFPSDEELSTLCYVRN